MVEEVFMELTRQQTIWYTVTWPVIMLCVGLLTGVFLYLVMTYGWKLEVVRWYRNIGNEHDKRIAVEAIEEVVDATYKLGQLSNCDYAKSAYNNWAKLYAEMDRMRF